MITVTLQQIKDAHPCEDGWKKVLKANGGLKADYNKPFPLVSILDSNGLDDALWVIDKVDGMREHKSLWYEFSRWCAFQNVEKIAKYCSVNDYDLILNWLESGDETTRKAAREAALSVAGSGVEWEAEVVFYAALAVAWSALAAELRRSARVSAWTAGYEESELDLVLVARSAQAVKLKELIARVES